MRALPRACAPCSAAAPAAGGRVRTPDPGPCQNREEAAAKPAAKKTDKEVEDGEEARALCHPDRRIHASLRLTGAAVRAARRGCRRPRLCAQVTSKAADDLAKDLGAVKV